MVVISDNDFAQTEKNIYIFLLHKICFVRYKQEKKNAHRAPCIEIARTNSIFYAFGFVIKTFLLTSRTLVVFCVLSIRRIHLCNREKTFFCSSLQPIDTSRNETNFFIKFSRFNFYFFLYIVDGNGWKMPRNQSAVKIPEIFDFACYHFPDFHLGGQMWFFKPHSTRGVEFLIKSKRISSASIYGCCE